MIYKQFVQAVRYGTSSTKVVRSWWATDGFDFWCGFISDMISITAGQAEMLCLINKLLETLIVILINKKCTT